MTPSRETLAPTMIFRMFLLPLSFDLDDVRRDAGRPTPVGSTSSVSVPGEGVLGQDRVDLANSPRSALVRARGQDPLHGLDACEATLDRHARTPDVDLLNRDTRRGQRHVGVWRTVCARLIKPVAEDESARRFDLQDLPVPAVPVALGPDHPVLDATARCQVVLFDSSGVVRRAPPALELTWIGPQLPHPLRRRVELGLDSHREPVRILADGGDGHWSCSLVSVMRSAMRSLRPRHSSSYCRFDLRQLSHG